MSKFINISYVFEGDPNQPPTAEEIRKAFCERLYASLRAEGKSRKEARELVRAIDKATYFGEPKRIY